MMVNEEYSQVELAEAVQMYVLNMISHSALGFEYDENYNHSADEEFLIRASLEHPEIIDLVDILDASPVEYLHGKEQKKTA